jgi:hypothetical protein
MKFTKLFLPLGIIIAMSILYGKKREESKITTKDVPKAEAAQTIATEKEAPTKITGEAPNIEWGDTKPNGNDMEKKLEELTKTFEAALIKKYPDTGKDKLEEFKKVEAEHKSEIDKLEKDKDAKKVNFLSYLIKRGTINSKYKKKYAKFVTEASKLQADWDEEIGELWQAWDAGKKSKYNDSLKDLQDLIKAISEKEQK